MSYEFACRNNADFKTLKDYNLVYEGTYNSINTDLDALLEGIFTDGNVGQLRQLMAEQYSKARSISVSDIIEVDGNKYYCDIMGFEAIGKGEG